MLRDTLNGETEVGLRNYFSDQIKTVYDGLEVLASAHDTNSRAPSGSASGSIPAAMARSRDARMSAFSDGSSSARRTCVFSSHRCVAQSRTNVLACVGKMISEQAP